MGECSWICELIITPFLYWQHHWSITSIFHCLKFTQNITETHVLTMLIYLSFYKLYLCFILSQIININASEGYAENEKHTLAKHLNEAWCSNCKLALVIVVICFFTFWFRERILLNFSHRACRCHYQIWWAYLHSCTFI